MGEALKGFGIVCALVCAYFVYQGLNMPVVVNPDGQGYVANLQLMHTQLVTILIGAALAGVAIVSFVGGVVVDRLRDETDRILKGETPPPIPEIYS